MLPSVDKYDKHNFNINTIYGLLCVLTCFPELEKICPIAFMLTTSFMEHIKNIFGPRPI